MILGYFRVSKLHFTEIFGKNFNSLGEFKLEIKPGRHLVVGTTVGAKSTDSNGSGKSSIFESLLWTCYKAVLRERDPSFDQAGNCYTGVSGTFNEHQYKIVRNVRNGKEKSNTSLFVDGEDVSARLTSSTDDEILKLMGISANLFMSTVVVTQGFQVSIVSMTPTLRKSILEESIGFEVWEKIRSEIIAPLPQLKSAKDQTQFILSKKRESMISLNSRIETMKSSNNDQQELLKLKISEIQDTINQLNDKKNNLLLKQVNSLNGSTIESIKSKISSVTNTVSELTSSIRGLSHGLSVGICQSCGQPHTKEMVEETKAKILNAERKKSELENSITSDVKSLERFNAINKLIEEISSVINSNQYSINSIRQSLASMSQKQNIEKLSDDLDNLVSDVNELSSEIHQVDFEIKNLDYINSQLLPSSKFRSSMLDKYLSYINQILSETSPLIFDNLKVSLVTDSRGSGVDFVLIKDNSPITIKQLSGGERRRLDIIVTLAIQRFLVECSGLTTNLLVFDEIFDGIEPKGFDTILNAIEHLFPESSSVYVISHNESLKSRFDSVIKVVKEDRRSRIE